MNDGDGVVTTIFLALVGIALVFLVVHTKNSTIEVERCVKDERVTYCQPWTSPLPTVIELEDGGYIRNKR